MRISDWSSDVCSSDLPPSWSRPASTSGPHRRLREAVRERGHVGALTADPVPAAAARRRGRVLRAARAVVHGALRRTRTHRHPGGAQGPAERPEEPVRPPPRARHRSEEHTSELQSLMRISYAVFCLKKKTHRHNTSTQYK